MAVAGTILVVDDEVKITEVVRSYLENLGYRTAAAHSGSAALSLFETLSPILIILDLMLPDMSGEDICRVLRQKSSVPIIMLTAKIEDADIVSGLAIGADDYVTKPFSPRQLVARVEAVLRRSDGRQRPEASGIMLYGGEVVIDVSSRTVSVRDTPVALTPNEFNILSTLAKHPKKTFTREELISFALGADYDGYDRVIDTHIKNLRHKLCDDGRTPRYLLTVHGVGYRIGGAG